MNNKNSTKSFSCPVPENQYDKILLAHGGGGTLMHNLIDTLFKKHFNNDILKQGNDSAIIDFKKEKAKYAFTTDSYVVQPIFFPGGDIGSLAIYGTVNDLSVSGAKPEFVSVGFIIEEGFLLSDLERIVISMKRAADYTGVKIVTGDTKVIDATIKNSNFNSSEIGNIYINTSGIGKVYEDMNISPSNCIPGDVIILSGSIAEHGISIISAREHIEFETEIKSDLAPLNGIVEAIYKAGYGKHIRVMRDPTRGGVTSSLNEIAKSGRIGIRIYEERIPVLPEIVGACELFGFDPLYVANEGKLIAIVSKEYANEILETIR
ncbi:MAG: hydrogenase expression/formation protein HypE, partial [Ignavibacteria bacterium]|nr:hydrogenase expression/formation protein HypE [Ignavibacteria bacterium]